ncbi:MAG: sigma-70 family polymerase sigma factor [Herbinix sp.]|jgi:RNA polymerase sigma-70 factor (ECF subfamily)|nr:sigma-70 family polymerase sigma factor [Herbinix sp.]
MDYSFGTDEYIQQVLNKYSTMLIRLAFTYVKNTADAEDIVQDVYVSLIKKGQSFDSEEHEKAWLIRVTINKCKNRLKSSWNRFHVPLEEDISYLPTEDSEVLSEVLSLPQKYRTVIHLFYYENYSMNEIAAMLKKNPATIGTWLARGRKLLKSKLIGGFDYE